MALSYNDWLTQAQSKLHGISETARLDSQLILAHILRKDTTHLLTWPEKLISDTDLERLQVLLDRRQSGEPMAYILGQCEFWGLTLDINSDVLVPRSDTEVLVETVLKVLHAEHKQNPKILDLGTGSGAIALALATELPEAIITAIDVSEAALAVAERNFGKHKIANITCQLSDWFGAMNTERFDIIVSNPPYVAENDPHMTALTYEPELALTAKNAGYADLELLIQQAPNYSQNGWLFLEHGFAQAEKVRQLMHKLQYQKVNSAHDIAGHERCTFGIMPSHG